MVSLTAEFLTRKGLHFGKVVYIIAPFSVVRTRDFVKNGVAFKFSQKFVAYAVKFKRKVVFPAIIEKFFAGGDFVAAVGVTERDFARNVLFRYKRAVFGKAKREIYSLMPHEKTARGHVVYAKRTFFYYRNIFF